MVSINLPLLHGSLGYGDEIIFGSVVVIFLGIMVMQWIAMRAADDEKSPEHDQDKDTPPDTPTDDPETFHLD